MWSLGRRETVERHAGLVLSSRCEPSFQRVSWASVACGWRLRPFPAFSGLLWPPSIPLFASFSLVGWLCLGQGPHLSPEAHCTQRKKHPLQVHRHRCHQALYPVLHQTPISAPAQGVAHFGLRVLLRHFVALLESRLVVFTSLQVCPQSFRTQLGPVTV